jgi:general secretion pathway protein C
LEITSNKLWSDLRGLEGAQVLATASRVLPPWVSLLLVLVIGWQLATVVWMFVPASGAGDPVAVPASLDVVTSGTDSAVNLQAIADAHLFGVARQEDEAPVDPGPVPGIKPPDTSKNLELKGTIASAIAAESAAIISDGGNKEQVYSIGEAVTSGAKLHAVYADRVVLNENGQLTNLELPKEFPEGSAPPVRRVASSMQRTAKDARSIQSVVAQNISRLSDVIRPTPYFVNGQQQGYRVYPGRDRRQFAALGLRPGDLIKDIDGQSLSDPTQAMQIFQSLGTAEQVSVTVERNGQPETIVLKTNQLEMGNKETE